MKNVKSRYMASQLGLSLVELMVAMVISLFLSAGLFTMFGMSSSNVTTTSQFNQLQENGRIALAILERDLSQLGFMGDITGTDFILGVNTTVDANVAAGDDCIGAGLNNSSLPNAQPAHFRRLWGYESGVSAESLSCLASSNVKAGTDVLQLKRFIGPSVTAGDSDHYFVAATPTQAIFFNAAVPSSALDNARIWEYQHHVYFISEDDGVPILKRKTLSDSGMNNNEQLIEGIENIRILYGFDNDGDSTPERYVPAADVTDLMWDNQGFQRLVALKVYVLVRSVNTDPSYSNKTQYLLGDKTILAPSDNYRRKIMSTTVVLENPVLIRS